MDLLTRLGFEIVDTNIRYDAATVDELMTLGDRFENEWQRLATLGGPQATRSTPSGRSASPAGPERARPSSCCIGHVGSRHPIPRRA